MLMHDKNLRTIVLNPCVLQGPVVCFPVTNSSLVTDPEWGHMAQCQAKLHSCPRADSSAWLIKNNMQREIAIQVLRNEMAWYLRFTCKYYSSPKGGVGCVGGNEINMANIKDQSEWWVHESFFYACVQLENSLAS